MRRYIVSGVLMALAFLVPATPALAQTGSPGLDQDCHTVERKVYKDIREFSPIDLDTATAVQVRLRANQILFVATTNGLTTLESKMQELLGPTSTDADLRAFLATVLQKEWPAALRAAVLETLTGAGANVTAAARKALDEETVDAFLAYLNDGLYDARAKDCASPSSPASASPSVSASASVSPAAGSSSTSPGASGGAGGGLPVTGAGTATLAGVGGGLLILGAAGYLIARRRRTRFVA
jgi:LPXTG-motif cell wall-anchored protein